MSLIPSISQVPRKFHVDHGTIGTWKSREMGADEPEPGTSIDRSRHLGKRWIGLGCRDGDAAVGVGKPCFF